MRRAGITDEQIVFHGADVQDGPFTAAEQAVLALADEMVLANLDGRLTGDQRAALAEHFDEGQILELDIVTLVTRETSCPIVKPGSAH